MPLEAMVLCTLLKLGNFIILTVRLAFPWFAALMCSASSRHRTITLIGCARARSLDRSTETSLTRLCVKSSYNFQ